MTSMQCFFPFMTTTPLGAATPDAASIAIDTPPSSPVAAGTNVTQPPVPLNADGVQFMEYEQPSVLSSFMQQVRSTAYSIATSPARIVSPLQAARKRMRDSPTHKSNSNFMVSG